MRSRRSTARAASRLRPAPGRSTRTAVVEVADTGPGVPPDLTDKIFNPFFTTKVQGSGLGLAIVRKIVDAHDGQIDLFSSPGIGTRFRVTLPVSTSASWFQPQRTKYGASQRKENSE